MWGIRFILYCFRNMEEAQKKATARAAPTVSAETVQKAEESVKKLHPADVPEEAGIYVTRSSVPAPTAPSVDGVDSDDDDYLNSYVDLPEELRNSKCYYLNELTCCKVGEEPGSQRDNRMCGVCDTQLTAHGTAP